MSVEAVTGDLLCGVAIGLGLGALWTLALTGWRR